MSELTRIEERFRAINPVPDVSNPPMPARSNAATLLALEERTVEMQQLTRPKEKTTQRRSGPTRWLVAAGAAILVLVVLGAVALLDEGGVEPGDTPTATVVVTSTTVAPTTTAAPTTATTTTEATPATTVGPAVEAQALRVAEAYATAPTIEERLALVAEDAVFSDGTATFTGRDEIRAWMEAMADAGFVVEASDFRANGTRVTYHTVTGLGDGSGGIEGVVATNTTVDIEDGLIQRLTRR